MSGRSCGGRQKHSSVIVDAGRMSFFGFEQSNDLENERRKFLEGGLSGANQEDVAVYTWGEESYDGLGDALLEGGDELNDETFGATGDIGASSCPTVSCTCLDAVGVGKDFDFSSTAIPDHENPTRAHPQVSQVVQKAQTPSRVETCMVLLAIMSLSPSESLCSLCSPLLAVGRNLGQQISILRSSSQQWLQNQRPPPCSVPQVCINQRCSDQPREQASQSESRS